MMVLHILKRGGLDVRSYQKYLFLCIIIVALISFVCMRLAVQAKATTTCGRWQVVPSANIRSGSGFDSNSLYAVAALASNDVWAVGNFNNSTTKTVRTLIEHWDGKTWKVISSPHVSSSGLEGVARIPGTNELWTVGSYGKRNIP
jgi:hypothetical protein